MNDDATGAEIRDLSIREPDDDDVLVFVDDFGFLPE